MLYVDNLKHGLNSNPFSLPYCAFLDSNMNDSITSMDHRRDIHSETAEFGNLMVSQTVLETIVVIMKKRPRKYISPFKLPGCRPQVPLAKVLALRNKIASDEKLKR